MIIVETMLLAIDTATDFAGLALWGDGEIWAEETWYSAMAHSVQLMPRIERMLKTQGITSESLSAIGVSLGPGSFTGLRIGLAAAKGLAMPYHLPVIGIPTLDAVAYPFRDAARPVWAVIAAGRGRIDATCYAIVDSTWTQTVPPMVTTVEALAQQITAPALVVGELDPDSANSLQEAQAGILVPSPALRTRRPACIAEMAAARLKNNDLDDLTTLAPIYLRTADGKQTVAEGTNEP